MNNVSVSEMMDEATLRAEKVVYLAASITESLPDDARELLEENSVEELTDIFGELPDYLIEALGDGEHYEISQWLLDTEKLGYVVQFATPIREPSGSSGKFWSYSWGYYRTKWFYGETMEKAINLGVAWARNCEKKDKDKVEAMAA